MPRTSQSVPVTDLVSLFTPLNTEEEIALASDPRIGVLTEMLRKVAVGQGGQVNCADAKISRPRLQLMLKLAAKNAGIQIVWRGTTGDKDNLVYMRTK